MVSKHPPLLSLNDPSVNQELVMARVKDFSDSEVFLVNQY